jgi:ABC-type bacteriocin/lantibiotic exporter with double-glycine peptidase domain
MKGSGKYDSQLFKGELFDKKIRRMLVDEKVRYKANTRSRLYLTTEKGGCNLKSISDSIEETTIHVSMLNCMCFIVYVFMYVHSVLFVFWSFLCIIFNLMLIFFVISGTVRILGSQLMQNNNKKQPYTHMLTYVREQI